MDVIPVTQKGFERKNYLFALCKDRRNDMLISIRKKDEMNHHPQTRQR